jgi:hypothetical protein
MACRMSWAAGGDEQQPYRCCKARHATRQPTAPRGARTELDHAVPLKSFTIRQEYISREYTSFMVVSRVCGWPVHSCCWIGADPPDRGVAGQADLKKERAVVQAWPESGGSMSVVVLAPLTR